jgi:D-xylose transport system permease protein
MIGAFVLCLVFNLFTDGRFLTPRNIFNLTIQTVSWRSWPRAWSS